jgi:hypothetical protein
MSDLQHYIHYQQDLNQNQRCLALICVNDYNQCAIVGTIIERSLNRFTVALEFIPKDRFNIANEM